MRTLVAIATLATAVLGVLNARSQIAAAEAPVSANAAPEAAVAIRTFQFAPDTIRVKVGTRIVWTNADEIEHTITSGTPDSKDGRFNGVVHKRGASYSAVLEKAGTYRYFCDRHRFMNGTVIVNP